DVHVRNTSDQAQKLTVALSFPGPTQAEAQISPTSKRDLRYIDWWPTSDPIAEGVIASKREPVQRGSFNGHVVSSATGTAYAIGLISDKPARFGSAISISGYEYCTGQQWVGIGSKLPKAAPGDFGSSVATDVEVAPRQEKIVRFVVAWYSPIWKGEKDNHFARMYTSEYKEAADVARFVADDHEALLHRVLAWQQAV